MKNTITGGVECAWSTDDGIWYIYRKIAILCFFSYEMKKVTKICLLPTENYAEESEYTDMVVYEQNIYILPRNSRYIVKYSIKEGKCSTIMCTGSTSAMYYKMSVIGDKIYCIPCKGKKMIIIDFEKKNVKVIEDKLLSIKNREVVNDYCVYGDDIYIAIWKSNIIMKYSTRDRIWKNFYIGEKDCSYIQICIKNENMYLFEEKSKNIQKIRISDKKIIGEKKNLGVEDVKMYIDSEGNIILDEVNTENIWVLSETMEYKEVYNLKLEKSRNTVLSVLYKCGTKINNCDKLTLIMPDGKIYEIVNGEFIEKYKIQIEIPVKFDIEENFLLKKDCIFSENEILDLKHFLLKIGESKK